MKQLVLTVIGPDKPGLVDSLSKTVLENHGNWLASNLSHLAGHFAGIVQVEVDETHLQTLQDALASLEDLSVKVELGAQALISDVEKLTLVITGNDRPGIVQELSSVIQHKGANILHFTSKQQSAPNWGSPIFNAQATVTLPKGMDADEVISALESIANDIFVEAEVDESDSHAYQPSEASA
ncbi:glycine cleavage system protein R [Flocculibacter collagenilyticus]|uniref:glycine cleavage system protein R n=1 Tax=Flocculibacter collagenilyticus TaxID=2744479 RepID=UPI0018F52AC1|nr:ACT domain-containing protein [Flocculibacter collagenilyticus]